MHQKREKCKNNGRCKSNTWGWHDLLCFLQPWKSQKKGGGSLCHDIYALELDLFVHIYLFNVSDYHTNANFFHMFDAVKTQILWSVFLLWYKMQSQFCMCVSVCCQQIYVTITDKKKIPPPLHKYKNCSCCYMLLLLSTLLLLVDNNHNLTTIMSSTTLCCWQKGRLLDGLSLVRHTSRDSIVRVLVPWVVTTSKATKRKCFILLRFLNAIHTKWK